MKFNLFSENMKLADLILANVRLLYVLPCFGIELGFGDKTVKQMSEENNISVPLLLLVCNIYTFDDYQPDAAKLGKIPLEGIIEYLRNSHKDYLNVRMPKLISEILDLIDCCHIKDGDILTTFCKKYEDEVIAHFKYEEEIAFPYIHNLIKGNKGEKYKIEEYESNHSNIDEALSDLKNIIIKYLPKECTIEKCRDVLLDLFMFEYDLSKHTLLEDKILISLVERIEKGI